MRIITASLLILCSVASFAGAQTGTIAADPLPFDAWAKFSSQAYRYHLNQSCETVAYSVNMVAITIGDTSYIATMPDEINSVSELKSNATSFYCFVQLKNGKHYRVQVNRISLKFTTDTATGPPQDFFSPAYAQLRGDDLYLISSSQVAVSRDEAQSWQMDMAGLPNTVQLYGSSFDSAQTLYIGTSLGLYRQALGSAAWEHVDAAGTSWIQDVYIDPLQRIWTYASNTLRVSADGGATFTAGPTGLGGYRVTFNGDVFGNVYAAGGSLDGVYDSLYYSAHGTAPFVRIDQSLFPLFHAGSGRYTSVVGDSLLIVGTIAGPYVTSDFGQTWTQLHPFPASRPKAYIPSVDGAIVSTETGVYRRQSGSWHKVFPVDGYGSATVLSDPTHNALYVQYESPYRSVDGGETWTADSAGFGAVKGVLAIDNLGTLHVLHNEYVPGIGDVAKPWRRESGGNWTVDTNGLPGQLDTRYIVSISAPDEASGSVLLLVTTGGATSVYRSAPTGGWDRVADYPETIFSAASAGGVTVATARRGVLNLASPGQWQYISTPSDVNPNAIASSGATVSASGRIWAWFEMFDVNDPGAPAIRRGIYYSDDQSTWTKVRLDSTQIARLIPSGDSAFVLTTNSGMYHVSMQGSSVEVQERAQSSLRLEMLRGSRTAVLRSSATMPHLEQLSIIDLSGREVYTVSGSLLHASQVRLDLSALASGPYVYQLLTEGHLVTGKLFIP